jgi:hypothetical protein
MPSKHELMYEKQNVIAINPFDFNMYRSLPGRNKEYFRERSFRIFRDFFINKIYFGDMRNQLHAFDFGLL